VQITEDFLLSEISDLEREMEKAQTFTARAQATVTAYKMLIQRLNTPEEAKELVDGNAI
jgi:hypothetical protein